MTDKIHLIVLTPYCRYFEGNIDFLEVHSEKYNLGILPNHAPLISTVEVSKMIIRVSKSEMIYAVGGGIINVERDKTTLILNSIERSDEIDVARAQEAKKRAEQRLSSKDDTVDVNRAKAALLRATNRIQIYSSKNR